MDNLVEMVGQEGRVTLPILIFVLLGIITPVINELFFRVNPHLFRLVFLLPTSILLFYWGTRGGWLALGIFLGGLLSCDLVLFVQGHLSLPQWLAHDLPDLVVIGLIILLHNYFVGRIINRQQNLEKANRQLRHLALTDELTQTYNYRYFRLRLQEELLRSQREKSNLSLMILDIDDFKIYNDLHGHLAGDQLLQELSVLLKESVRSIDIVARYGGEEFVIILPHTGGTEATIVANRVRLAIANYPFPGGEQQPNGYLTVSIGIASYPENAGYCDELIAMADEALYRVKREQKNSVQLYFALSEDGHNLEFVTLQKESG